MKALLEHGGANSDATLVASDGQEFKVHQFPLSTHSPVFAAIFGQDQKQKKKKKKTTTRKSVQIEVDASAEAVRTLLHYIYLGTVASKEELTVELLSAADKVLLIKFFCFVLFRLLIIFTSKSPPVPSGRSEVGL